MFKLVLRLCVVGLLTYTAAIAAAPKQLNLEFDLLQQGAVIATIKEQLKVQGKQYQLTSITQGKGFYRLIGERTLSSKGFVKSGTLRPTHFEVQQSKRPGKALINDFDWNQKQLKMQIKGESQSQGLDAGTQDLLSMMYCWMWQPPTQSAQAMVVTNGKHVSRHQFSVSEEAQPLQTKAGSFRVVKLTEASGEKVVYLAKDKGYLPVKIVVDDDGKRMEQVLTSFNGQ